MDLMGVRQEVSGGGYGPARPPAQSAGKQPGVSLAGENIKGTLYAAQIARVCLPEALKLLTFRREGCVVRSIGRIPPVFRPEHL